MKYNNVSSLSEDKRIALAGQAAACGKTVGLVVDDETIAERYISKLLKQFPSIEVVFKGKLMKNSSATLIKISRKKDYVGTN